MARIIVSLVSSLTFFLLFNTRETVERETPAFAATSLIVIAMKDLLEMFLLLFDKIIEET